MAGSDHPNGVSSSSSLCTPLDATTYATLLKAVQHYVADIMSHYDSSHDYCHVQRVVHLALHIAASEGCTPAITHDQYTLQIIELSAYLHDVGDRKYLSFEQQQAVAVDPSLVISTLLITQFLQSLHLHIPDTLINDICHTIDYVSYSKEQKRMRADPTFASKLLPFTTQCVQDADRLDAIGSIGIARCCTFGGAKNRPMYDGQQWKQYYDCLQQLRQADDSASALSIIQSYKLQLSTTSDPDTLSHFYDKLFLLRDMMKTATGRRLANRRHQTMLEWAQAFLDEWHEATGVNKLSLPTAVDAS